MTFPAAGGGPARLQGTLTSVPGIRVGHATAAAGTTGCTVVLGPFRGGVDVRGMGTGTRELDVLSPHHLVPRVDALLLTGGSAFGLAAADGVVSWLEERGRGYPTPVAPVPIVPAAVIYDLRPDGPRPGPALGREACERASDAAVPMGRVGAGAGARVGKLAGMDRSAPGGLGSAAFRFGAHTVGALAVVNAVGNVLDATGRTVAGPRDAEGRFREPEELLREGALRGFGAEASPVPGGSTTLAVVATDAALGRIDLGRLARMASTALARRISPVHTPLDGDVTFALSTAEREATMEPMRLLALGAAARNALEAAIELAVRGEGGA